MEENVVADEPKSFSKTGGLRLIRCLVPNKIVGGLIGKGGDNISNLRTACPNATIKFKETPDCPNAEERVMHIECPIDDIYAIFSQLIPQIYDGCTKFGFDSVKEPELSVLFSGFTIGSIIGKGGKIISGLRSESGAFMKAWPNKLPNSDERVLLLKGDVDKIIKCLTMIYERVEMDTSPYNQYNPADSANMPRDPGVGGYVGEGGAGGGGGRPRPTGHTPNRTNQQPPFRKQPAAADYYSAPYNRAYPDPYNNAGGYHSMGGYVPPPPPTADYDETDQYSAQQGGNDTGVGSLLASFIIKYPYTMYPGADGEVAAVKEVTLENQLAGCIIGDKGARVREIRQSSGARIKIGDYDTAGPGERLITIVGTNLQTHLAEYMLQCCVQSYGGYKVTAGSLPTLPKRRRLQVNPITDYTSYPAQTNPGADSSSLPEPTSLGHW